MSSFHSVETTHSNKISETEAELLNDEETEGEESNSSLTATTGVEITCNTCYIKGDAFARLRLDGDFSLNDTMQVIEDEVSDTIEDIKTWIDEIEIDFTGFEIDVPPPSGIDFNLDLEELPGAVLELEFSGVELYVDLSTVFGAGLTYKLTLYMQGYSIDLGEDLFLGVVFSVDLIVSLESEIEIQHGFHIKFDEDVLLRVAMFSKEDTHLDFNGGEFEFLPVEVVTGGTVIQAVLQLSLRAGFTFETDLLPGPEVELGPFSTEDWKFAAGLETRLYANVADFKTNITVFDEDDCDLRIQHAFQFAVGAAAGAYVGVGSRTWGPQPETEVPLFPTTFADECITRAVRPTASPTASIEARQDDEEDDEDDELTTTTLSRDVTHTAVQCGETGVINCPPDKETLIESISEETLVTAVSSGVEPTWPETTGTAVETKEFGDGAQPITKSHSRRPIPTDGDTEDEDEVDEFFNQETGGVSNKLIIGLSVGLGVPALIILIAVAV